MNKTLRNKALRDKTRLITADFNGIDWCAPDGHFATAYPIYEAYRVKKSQEVPDRKPNLALILKTNEYALAEFVERDTTEPIERVKICSTINETTYMVNTINWNLLMSCYPNALPFVLVNGDPRAPVELWNDQELVAVIMPIWSR